MISKILKGVVSFADQHKYVDSTCWMISIVAHAFEGMTWDCFFALAGAFFGIMAILL